jgi:hypothetical protein
VRAVVQAECLPLPAAFLLCEAADCPRCWGRWLRAPWRWMSARGVEGVPDVLGGEGADALVDRECLLQVFGGWPRLPSWRWLLPIPSRARAFSGASPRSRARASASRAGAGTPAPAAPAARLEQAPTAPQPGPCPRPGRRHDLLAGRPDHRRRRSRRPPACGHRRPDARRPARHHNQRARHRRVRHQSAVTAGGAHVAGGHEEGQPDPVGSATLRTDDAAQRPRSHGATLNN